MRNELNVTSEVKQLKKGWKITIFINGVEADTRTTKHQTPYAYVTLVRRDQSAALQREKRNLAHEQKTRAEYAASLEQIRKGAADRFSAQDYAKWIESIDARIPIYEGKIRLLSAGALPEFDAYRVYGYSNSPKGSSIPSASRPFYNSIVTVPITDVAQRVPEPDIA